MAIPNFDNGARDLVTVSEYSNSSSPTTVTRMGDTIPTLSGITASLSAASGRGFTTKSQMVAQPGTVANQAARVTEGPDKGLYLWIGGAWVKTIDPLEQPPVWLAESATPSATDLSYARNFFGIDLQGTQAGHSYGVSVISRGHPTLFDRVVIRMDNTTNVAIWDTTAPYVPSGNGIDRLPLRELSGSGVTGVIWVNWAALPNSGLLVNTPTPTLVIDTAYLSNRGSKEQFQVTEQQMSEIDMDIVNLTRPGWISPTSDVPNAQIDITKHIYSIDLQGNVDPASSYGISALAKNHATLGNRLTIRANNTTNVAIFQGSGSYPTEANGLVRFDLIQVGGSGITGTAWLDWNALPDGLLVNVTTPTIIVDTTYLSNRGAKTSLESTEQHLETIDAQIASIVSQMDGSGNSTLHRAIRVALGGSSLTWGAGYLGEASYVGLVEEYLRTRLAVTMHADVLAPAATVIQQSNMWRGSVRRLSGIGQEVQFTLPGDELTVNMAKVRGNSGAAVCSLYVDGALHDTFTTYNPEPFGTRSKNFTGDGGVVKFDLGEAFTYGHVVTVNGGSALVGGMNIQLSGASIPSGWDYMIVRNYNASLNKVTHVLWFKTAPTGSVSCAYSYGESITYMRGTLGNIGQDITSTLESAFGDGAVSEDTTAPASVSSGLGFRSSDERACKTWRFPGAKDRTFRIVITGLDERASGATPWLDLNFVTNRMHHIMNAGIGGYTAALSLSGPVLVNRIDQLAAWRPDVTLYESCTNDDWLTGVAKGYVTRSGLSDAEVRSSQSTNYYVSISGTSNNKTVQDVRLPIEAITETSITVDNTAVLSVAPGDAVIIGSFYGDHRRVVVRLVDTVSGSTVTFKRPIRAEEFAQAETLGALIGDWVMFKSAPDWVAGVEACMQIVSDQNPDCRLHIATAGQPNFHHRSLFGYREMGMELARNNGWGFVDFYDATGAYQYNLPQTARLYIGPGQATQSTGASSYPLVLSTGATPSDIYHRMLHKPKVLVNGVDRTNKGVHVTGGYSRGWTDSVANPSLTNYGFVMLPYRLVFTSDIPASGATIEFFYSDQLWSADDTHPGRVGTAAGGVPAFGAAASRILIASEQVVA